MMHKIKYFSFALFLLFLSSSLIAQVEKTAKESKIKIEKKIEKTSGDVKSAKDMAEAAPTDMKKACSPDCKMACCKSEAKEMKAEMQKGEKMMKEAHAKNCYCDGCKTASAAIHHDHNMMKKSHSVDCSCEGCKMAKEETKKMKAHGEDCTCEGCAKT